SKHQLGSPGKRRFARFCFQGRELATVTVFGSSACLRRGITRSASELSDTSLLRRLRRPSWTTAKKPRHGRLKPAVTLPSWSYLKHSTVLCGRSSDNVWKRRPR